MAAHAAAVPLLNLSAKADKPRRNMYAFFYATLASMTTIFMGYNLAQRAVHPGRPGPVRRAGRGPRRVDQRVHARVDPRRRLGGGPPGPPRHAGARQRVAHGRRAHHVARRKLRRARGRALRHQRRLGVLHRRHLRVQRRDLAGVHARGFLSSFLDMFISIVLYSPLVFRKAGMSSNGAILGATVAVGVFKMCSVLVATLLSDRLGRRPLLLASTAGVATAMASLGVTLCAGTKSTASMAASVSSVLAFMAAFSIGFGPMAGTYSSEIMPLRLRAQDASLGNAVNRLTCGLVSMTFISLADWITMPGCFFLYAGVATTAFVFVYKRFPETKGRSLEDMDVLFAKWSSHPSHPSR